jgi:gamma-glutamyltranspeptidase/glutathione hydrolase
MTGIMNVILKYRLSAILLILLLTATCVSLPVHMAAPATGQNGMVVASHPIAANIGLRVLEDGGNAIDAAVATGLALGVVDQFNSGIGGGGFIIIRMADGTVYTIDGRETASGAASRNMYIRDGKCDSDLSKIGPLAVGVPGILAAYEKALELAGTREIAALIEPSIAVAEQGFELDQDYIGRYEDAVPQLLLNSESAKIYFDQDRTQLQAGDVLRQPDLGRTYRNIRDIGTSYFYRGEFAAALADFMKETGGLITREDMENYRALAREPIIGTYRGCEIVGMAPPSSGGVHILQLLNMVEASGVLEGKSGWDTESMYWVSRFMNKAFEDRAAYLGDADFYPVPVERLTSKEYAEECVHEIYGQADSEPSHEQTAAVASAFCYGDRRHSMPSTGSGRKWSQSPSLEGAGLSPQQLSIATSAGLNSHTTNLCVIDRWGNAVVINQTVNLTYGSKITLPGTGVILNNEMDDFSAQPGAPNAFGLIGSEANCIAPGKRPLSSMAPTIVVRDGKPVLILGGAGGPVIITAVFETIVDVLNFGMHLEEAQAQPRFHHQYKPNVLIVEDEVPLLSRIGLFLRTRHPVVRSSGVIHDRLGRVNAIAWSGREGAYVGVADPRSRGCAAGY